MKKLLCFVRHPVQVMRLLNMQREARRRGEVPVYIGRVNGVPTIQFVKEFSCLDRKRQ